MMHLKEMIIFSKELEFIFDRNLPIENIINLLCALRVSVVKKDL